VTTPISIRLDLDVRETLEAEARAHGIGLATYLRDLARQAARDIRRARIRQQSDAVAKHIARDPEARAFTEDWSKPDWPPS